MRFGVGFIVSFWFFCLSVQAETQIENVNSGDLIFLDLDCPLCEAIETVTQQQYRRIYPGSEPPRFSHVGILQVEKDGSTFVIESLPGRGVIRSPLAEVLKRVTAGENQDSGFRIGRFKKSLRATAKRAVVEAVHLLGTGYDQTFQDLHKPYCSALIWLAYRTHLRGQVADLEMFKLYPMEFGKPGTSAYALWSLYFEQLKIPMPTGLPAISPVGIYMQARAQDFFYELSNFCRSQGLLGARLKVF